MKVKKFKKIEYFVHPKESIFSGLIVRENTQDAFENAIKRGMKEPNDWMYMYSRNYRDYFKNYWTRNYISYPQFGFFERLLRKLGFEE